MLLKDILPLLVPFIVGLLLYLKTGYKFWSATAVIVSGIAYSVYIHDIKALWLTIVAFVLLWFLILIFTKN